MRDVSEALDRVEHAAAQAVDARQVVARLDRAIAASLDGESIADVARATGLDPATLRNRLARDRRRPAEAQRYLRKGHP